MALSGAPAADHLIRRAARIAQRAKGELIGAQVVSDSGLSGRAPSDHGIAAQRRLLDELGGEYRKVTGGDIATALVELARSENATQIVLGASERSRWQELLNGSVINRVVRMSGPIDVHVISRPTDVDEPGRRLPPIRGVLTPLSSRRQLWGWVLVLAGLPLITSAFANLRGTFGLTSVLLLYLVVAMVVALVGGVLPAGVAVVGGFLLGNWYFTPPLYQFSIADAENLLALIVYAIAAGIVAVLVDRVGRSRLRAARASAEAEALAALAGAMSRPGSIAHMLGQLRTTFSFASAALVTRFGSEWTVLERSGDPVPADPGKAVWSRDLHGVTLVLDGGSLSAEDQRVLDAFAAQVGAAAEAERLQGEAGKAAELAAANTLRASLLQAVSHDLRTPLASIKASVSSLRQDDVDWSDEAVEEFQATIESETDRLTELVANLLDMSRLQASALTVDLRPTGVEETVLAAIASLGAVGRDIQVDVPETLIVSADAALLERALANLLGNAVRVAAPDAPARVTAGSVNRHGREDVDIRVIDRGPGIRMVDRDRVFQPFQRLVDNQADGSGVGLGLPIARGFTEAMGGELTIDDTPGGGVTMVLSLASASA